jgi:Fic/DOC family
MIDPYIDPQSGVLRNRFGLADQQSLDRAEANAVSIRSILLQLNPLEGNFDSEHLKAIHSYLFRDVYDWAGQFRTIALAKAEDIRGGRVIRFTSPDLIEEELKQVFDELAADHFLERATAKGICSQDCCLVSRDKSYSFVQKREWENATPVRASIGRQLRIQTSFRSGQQRTPNPGQHPVG